MLAMPKLASFCLKTLIKLRIMRAPEAPIGWPKATAPPFTLTRSWSISSNFILARATAAKASLIS